MKIGRAFITLLGTMFLIFCVTSVYAQPQSVPNGPYVEDEQNVSLSSIMTNEELAKKLQDLESRSKGIMQLEIAGYSDDLGFPDDKMELGYPLFLCKFGKPDPSKARILITTQIHGNEPLGTEAAINIMQNLIAGGQAAKNILDNVTVWFMPRVNPDGAMHQSDGEWYPIRQSSQDWNPEYFGLAFGTRAPWYYSSRNGGYDLNRDTNPNLDFNIADYSPTVIENFLNSGATNNSELGGLFVTPEARIITSVYKRLIPEVFIDIHHRGFNTLTDDDNRQVYIQIAAEVADPYDDPFTGDHYEVSDDVLTLAKQVNAVGWLSLQLGNSAFGAIQKYPEVNLPGTTLGAFALNNTAIMLIEIAGQTQNMGQKASGRLIKTATDPVMAILSALADGSIHDVDPAIYDAVPESANRISDPSTRDE